MKLDILAIGVHPDDVELSCSGTLLRHIAAGKKVGLLDLTRGELGTRGTAEIRDQEAANSAKKMGALVRDNLKMADGFFQNDKEHQLQIIQILRKYQPEIVLANALDDRHPDHGRAAKLTHDACFLSGLIKIPTYDEDGNLQDRWRPKVVYHYIQDYDLKPDFIVDITDFMDQKLELVQTFESQFYNPKSKEPESPISSKAFLDALIGKNRGFGRPAGVEFAEGFNVVRPMLVDDLFDLR
ncbi:MAG: bacillithiol biosynthesis deacetylase BshB1 [Saprospiraceae bacterium]